MERLTESSLLASEQKDPRASDSWLVDNVWHPFVNGTGVKQLANNFVKEDQKLQPDYVPEAKTFSPDWIAHTLASAGGAVLTYAVAGKAAGVGLGALSSRMGLEGTAANILTNQATAQIVGAGLYDFIKAPNQGETRLGNMAGSVAAFSVFSGGNYLLGTSKTIAESALYTGMGRVGVGAVGGLTSLETSHVVSNLLGSDAKALTWDDRFKAMANGGFVNAALPPISKAISDTVDGALNSKPFKFSTENEAKSDLATSEIAKGTARAALLRSNMDDLESRAKSSGSANDVQLTLLKQQFNDNAREQQMLKVAGQLSNFVGDANKSVHIAIYDLRLQDPRVEKIVVDALNGRAENNVDVHIAYFQPESKGVAATPGKGFAPHADAEAPEPEPGEIPVSGATQEFLSKLSPKIKTHAVSTTDVDAINKAAIVAEIPDPFGAASGRSATMPHVDNGHEIVDTQHGNDSGLDSNVDRTGITGAGKLMHNKYIVRDAGTNNGAVWTGSTNFTDDAFGRQDNNILQISSPELANVYEKNFQELVNSGEIRGTGKDSHTTVPISGGSVTVAFSPGDGAWIDKQYAEMIANAKNNIHIASMVISSPDILQALADQKAAGVPIDGIYDGPQMNNVVRAWSKSTSDASAEKLANWNAIKDSLVMKKSHPYSPDGPHDFMHDKLVSVDDEKAATGSFNLSMNATKNAENVLIFDQPQIATQYRSYIQDLISTYGKSRRPAVPTNPAAAAASNPDSSKK